MLWTLLFVLLVLWLLGFGYGVGSLIHILLVLCLIVLLAQVFWYGPRNRPPPL